MSDLQNITSQILKFRDARDWKQFHNPKDMALSLILEASELAEHFQWKSESDLKTLDREAIGDELADVLYWVLLLASDLGIDLEKAFHTKMKKNERKYPIEKAKGKSDKYSEL